MPQKSFISSKYISMLMRGNVLMVLTVVMGVLDALIAGVMLGEESVDGICLALPVYSLAGFFSVCFSYGVPILYPKKTGPSTRARPTAASALGLR